MKQVYILTKEQSEKLENIQIRISVLVDFAYDELKDASDDSKIYRLLDRLTELSDEMGNVLKSE